MALDSYTNLKLELVAWIARSDVSNTSGGTDTYIDLAEAWFNRNLRVRQMVTVNTALTVSGTGTIDHPADWQAWRRVSVMNTPIQNLDIVSDRAALQADNTNAQGYPRAVIVEGTHSYVWPAPNGTYTYRGIYYATIPALSGSQATNWLLTAYPDAYLLGALAYGYGYLQDDPRAAGWRQAFADVVSEITTASGVDEYGDAIGSPVIRNVV